MIRNAEIKGCPLDIEDSKRALYLFGKSEAVVKGKTVYRKASKIEEVEVVQLPIKLKNKKINLSVDVLFIQGIPFLHTTSADLHFKTVEAFPNTLREIKKIS